MKVFLSGGTGFVGSEVLRQLTAAGHAVRCLVRRGSEGKLAVRERVEIRHGDVTEPATLAGGLEGCEAVIHLVGIIREYPARGITFAQMHTAATRHVVAAARAQGVRRYLQMSANGTRENAATAYHRTKWEAEEAVRASGLAWTIFRPSLIFGPRDEFVNMLAGMIRNLPVVPVLGDGRYRMSPVAVEEVAAGFVRALEKPETVGRTFHCCGPASHSYDELLDLVGTALGRSHLPKLHHPLFLMKPMIAMLEAIPQFPVTSEQLTMLLEGNVCDPAEWSATFGITPVSFAEGIGRYLKA
jgi:NADH dehydrogenase